MVHGVAFCDVDYIPHATGFVFVGGFAVEVSEAVPGWDAIFGVSVVLLDFILCRRMPHGKVVVETIYLEVDLFGNVRRFAKRP